MACLPSFLSLIFPKKTDAARRLFLENTSATRLKINICVSLQLPYRRPNPHTPPSLPILSRRDTSCPYRPRGPWRVTTALLFPFATLPCSRHGARLYEPQNPSGRVFLLLSSPFLKQQSSDSLSPLIPLSSQHQTVVRPTP